MHNVRYDYSSVHVEVPMAISENIIAWGKNNIGESQLYIRPEDPIFGREDEIHATILYGIHNESSKEIEKLLRGKRPPIITLGKLGVFTNPLKFDVVMIEVISEDLKNMNDLLVKNVSHTNKYGIYRPHVTIAYVKKGNGWQFNKWNIWEGKTFSCGHAVFSSKNGFKERITF